MCAGAPTVTADEALQREAAEAQVSGARAGARLHYAGGSLCAPDAAAAAALCPLATRWARPPTLGQCRALPAIIGMPASWRPMIAWRRANGEKAGLLGGGRASELRRLDCSVGAKIKPPSTAAYVG